MKKDYSTTEFVETTILDKLSTVYSASLVTLLIREKEETRGGELVELVYLAITHKGDKIWFLKKEGFPISTMVRELLVMLKISFASFQDSPGLTDESIRILRAELFRRRALSK